MILLFFKALLCNGDSTEMTKAHLKNEASVAKLQSYWRWSLFLSKNCVDVRLYQGMVQIPKDQL